jgi:hypothetical protein
LSSQDVLAAVRRFAAARVGTVVFALPVSVQQRWVEQATVLHAAFGYVVSDVDDGIVDEDYAPTFDGATAYTSLRVPWYARDHGETTAQRTCAAQWTTVATPPAELPGEEVPADTWCEEVRLLDAAFAAPAYAHLGLIDTLLSRTLASPLTSTLGPLRHHGWGPRADAVLVWRATCSCWQEQAPYAPRQTRPQPGVPHTR